MIGCALAWPPGIETEPDNLENYVCLETGPSQPSSERRRHKTAGGDYVGLRPYGVV